MNGTSIVLAVGGVILVAALSLVMYELLQRARAERTRSLSHLKSNPMDAIEAITNANATSQVSDRHAVEDAMANENRLTDQEGLARAEFPGGFAPSRRFWILVMGTALVWLGVAVAEAAMSYKIWAAVFGQNQFMALFATIVSLAAPSFLAIKTAEAAGAHTSETARKTRISITAYVAALLCLMVVLGAFAPTRAIVEFGSQISQGEIQVQAFLAKGKTTDAAAEKAVVAGLKQQEKNAALTNAILIEITIALEFGAGFALPDAVKLLLYARTRAELWKAREATRHARQRQERRGSRQLRRIARMLAAAGLPQEYLARALANGTRAALPEATGDGSDEAVQDGLEIGAASEPMAESLPVAEPAPTNATPVPIPAAEPATFDRDAVDDGVSADPMFPVGPMSPSFNEA